jgi:hypothetical protein
MACILDSLAFMHCAGAADLALDRFLAATSYWIGLCIYEWRHK